MSSKPSPRISFTCGPSKKSSRELKSSPESLPAIAMATAPLNSRPFLGLSTTASPRWPNVLRSSRISNSFRGLWPLLQGRRYVRGPMLHLHPGPSHFHSQFVNLSIEHRRSKSQAIFVSQHVRDLCICFRKIFFALHKIDSAARRLAQFAQRTISLGEAR